MMLGGPNNERYLGHRTPVPLHVLLQVFLRRDVDCILHFGKGGA